MLRQLQILLPLTILFLLNLSQLTNAQIIFEVNSVGDAGDNNAGDGTCYTGDTINLDVIGDVQECTLRAALEENNAANDEVIIEFSEYIPVNESDYSLISPQTAYTTIQNKVTIAGDTHPNYDEEENIPKVVIDGSELSAGIGITIGADGTAIKNLSIGGFPNDGISIYSSDNVLIEGNHIGRLGDSDNGGNEGDGIEIFASEAAFLSHNTIVGNEGHGILINTDSRGVIAAGNNIGIYESDDEYHVFGNNGDGIKIQYSQDSNHIGFCLFGACNGNKIAGNLGHGINTVSGNQQILSNQIGVNPSDSGDSTFGNGGSGIFIESDGNTVGGINELPNTIGHSAEDGIAIRGSDNEIDGNFIGTDSTGNNAGNSGNGIAIYTGSNNIISHNQIRYNLENGLNINTGLTNARGNNISDNGNFGIYTRSRSIIGGVGSNNGNKINNNIGGGIRTYGTRLIEIRANYIGTDETGADLGNSGRGIFADATDSLHIGNTIGRGDDKAGNIIGYNNTGISIFRSEALIQGNYIGTNADGDSLGNAYSGILIDGTGSSGSSNNVIGYAARENIPADNLPKDGALGNEIAFNSTAISFSESDDYDLLNNSIRGNSIYNNSDENGIFLSDDALTNDSGDSDEGPNNLQNYPSFIASDTFINDSDELEFHFRVYSDEMYSEYPLDIDFYLVTEKQRQGKTFLGTHEYQDAANFVQGSIAIPDGVEISDSDYIIATATDADGNTSIFSELTPLSLPPAIGISQANFDFGDVSIGTSDTLEVSFTNSGVADLEVDLSFDAEHESYFTIFGDEDSFTLGEQEQLSVKAIFSPTEEKEYEIEVLFDHNAQNTGSPGKLTFAGKGVEEVIPPENVDLLKPGNEDENISLRPEFTWSKSEAAEEYQLQVALESTFTDLVTDSSIVDTTFTPTEELEANTEHFWRVKASNSDGESDWSDVFTFTTLTPTSIEDDAMPTEFTLKQNYPNPFNPTTIIEFGLTEAAEVKLGVYNLLGQQVTLLINERKSAGWHSIEFDASSLSSGMYIYRIETGANTITRKLTLIK